ncbi:MAG: helix-turn-helix domain-containing protein [Candidatus Eremiobacteraeota bacterium]|nr:helix-turn-helix domain-containing protein [Candidatus Eremiobacteraeota bacterium]
MGAIARDARRLSFGTLLREIRLEAGLSQEALAERARMSSGGISVLERGARRAPHRDTIALLADALELTGRQRADFEIAGRASDSSRRRKPPGTTPTARLGNLPFALTSFVGRHRSKSMLVSRLSEQRLVTLTGVGGVGKTRLSIEAAHDVAGSFPDGVWFVELAPVADSDFVPHRIAATLNVGERENGDAFIAQLRDKRLLVILDNCEHVLDACATFAKALLERCPHVHVLATSREALRITGERIIRVDPLGEASSVEMFLERLREAAPDFDVISDDENVRAICRALDGIPLAIELAAARVPAMSLNAVAMNLDRRLALLRRGDRAAVPRQQTMRALIDWSYELLSDEEQRAFDELSVFSGGCTVHTATAFALGGSNEEFNVLEVLTSLVEKSLAIVDLEVDESRYGLLEISREYAREKLKSRGALESAERRHAAVYFTLAQQLADEWEVTPSRTGYLRAVVELENWLAAIDWSLLRGGDVALGQRLVSALRRVWILFAPGEGSRLCRIAMEHASTDTPDEVLADLTFTESQIAFHQFEHPAACAAAQKALDLYRQVGNRLGAAHAQRIIGLTLVRFGDVTEGEAMLVEALAVAREFGADRLAGHLEGAIGMSRTIAGDLEGAIKHFTAARAISLAMGDEREALTHSLNLAEALRDAGDIEAALTLSEETLLSARKLDHVFAVINALSGMSAYLIALDRFDAARAYALEALEGSRKPRFGVFLLWILQHLSAATALKARASNTVARDVYERTARVFGYVDANLPSSQQSRDFTEKVEYDRTLETLRFALTEAELARLIIDGAAMTEDEAIEQAIGG